MLASLVFTLLGVQLTIVFGLPLNGQLKPAAFDLQGHRGGRGNTIENTLPSFAWGMIDGVNTLEMDNGITKDGVVVVWHDEFIDPTKCRDTKPAFKGDLAFPYVGKNIVNLTLAQIKTLDCGSERLIDFPMQLSYPGTKISTLAEVFEFVGCADPQRKVLFNIESKINAAMPQNTSGVNEFVSKQHAAFLESTYDLGAITYQSFDWRTLVAMKDLDSKIITSALASSATILTAQNGVSPWLAGLRLSDFPGNTTGVQLANAAHSINAQVLSPLDVDSASPVLDPTLPGFIPFTTKEMIDQAHTVGMVVKPWTVDRLNVADQLFDWGIDGIITDFPSQMRRRLEQRGVALATPFPQKRVLDCLAKHLQRV
ncbi:PLC-like phosphodiesterase [Collybia nuda]|uniref:PLC-like phosphodiesterase n=1 Tax=Collybia nuda TaxID=64659 RepID=A0A9P5XZ66_9AGAR|nr:PLC-like phosphodiesterase [Collybia nuda]